MKQLILAASAVLAIAGATAAQATVLTFDDIDLGGGGYGSMPANYAGYSWSNFAVINGPVYGPSGYANGVVSPNQVACACAGDFSGQTVDTLTKGGASFDLNSGYFTSAWNDGARLQVLGYSGGSVIYGLGADLFTSGPSFINFGWTGVDKVEFSISGGTPSGLPGGGDYFAIDNLSVDAVPEPASWAMMIVGFGLAGTAMRRRRTVVTA
jgi:hypothetical protein